MTRVLLTGISGVGKSAVIRALSARGFRAVDLDEGGYSALLPAPDDDGDALTPGLDWLWVEERVAALLAEAGDGPLFLGGCAPNQGSFSSQLDLVILLTAPAHVIVERLATRTTNPYGKRPEEVARVLRLKETVEPLLRRSAGHAIDTDAPLDQVVSEVLRLVGESA